MINEQIQDSTRNIASRLVGLFQQTGKKVVLAESCTGGLVSAILAEYTGVSQYLCGSAVTYQDSTKQQWLKIDPAAVQKYTAVSAPVTLAMARSVLQATRQADFAVAITGHLQPPTTQTRPHVYVAVVPRALAEDKGVAVGRFLLQQPTRPARQWEAARCALHAGLEYLRFGSQRVPCKTSDPVICSEPCNFRWQQWYRNVPDSQAEART